MCFQAPNTSLNLTIDYNICSFWVQSEFRIAHTVTEPTPNAKTSVTDVTVMATPACCIVSAIFSGSVRPFFS